MNGEKRLQIEKSHLCLVEGTHETQFIAALLRERRLDQSVGGRLQILEKGGVNNLTRSLRLLRLDPRWSQVHTLAVVRDADSAVNDRTGFQAAWDHVTGCLRTEEFSIPGCHAQFVGSTPRVGVFIMPDGTRDGMLETLCFESVNSSAVGGCVDRYFDCMRQHGLAPRNMHKARAHAYIAASVDPDQHTGGAARAGYWNLAAACFDPFVEFLQRVTGDLPAPSENSGDVTGKAAGDDTD